MRWMIVLLGLEVPVLIASFDWYRRSPDAFLGGEAGKAKWLRRLLLGLATGWLGVGNAVTIWYIMLVIRADSEGELQEVSANEKAFVKATPEMCISVITDIENYVQWSPGITKAEVLTRDNEGRPVKAAFVRDSPMGGGTIGYTMEMSYATKPVSLTFTMLSAEADDPEQAAIIDQMMGGMTSTYRFEANGDETLVDYDMHLSLPPQIGRASCRDRV